MASDNAWLLSSSGPGKHWSQEEDNLSLFAQALTECNTNVYLDSPKLILIWYHIKTNQQRHTKRAKNIDPGGGVMS